MRFYNKILLDNLIKISHSTVLVFSDEGAVLPGRISKKGTTMAMIRWGPFREMMSLRNALDKLFEESFDDVRRMADKCGCRIALGCYMFDYGKKKPMPVDLMEKQCQLGLKWLNDGSIDEMVFLASCICDLDFDAVKWTRNWIKEF